MTTARAEAESPFGDIWDYRRQLDAARRRRRSQEEAVEAALAGLRPGQVVHVSQGPLQGPGRGRRQRPPQGRDAPDDRDRAGRRAAAHGRRLRRRAPAVGTVKLPARSARTGPSTAGRCRALGRAKLERRRSAPRSRRGEPDRHPVELDPDLRQRMRAAGQAERYERELDRAERRVSRATTTRWPATSTRPGRARPARLRRRATALDAHRAGRVLARVFHESDLLVSECLHAGLFDGVDAAALAGLLSTFVYEHRSPEPPPPPWFPSADVKGRWRRIQATSEDLAADERATGLAEHRPPDPGFAAAAYAWVAARGWPRSSPTRSSPAVTSSGR